MKSFLAAAGMATAMTIAGASVASAQVIDPVCASAAEAAGLDTGYNIAFDAANNRCVATPIGAPGPLAGGLGGGAGAALGIGAALVIAIAVSGDT